MKGQNNKDGAMEVEQWKWSNKNEATKVEQRKWSNKG